MRRLIPHISVYQPNGWSNAILPIDVLHKLVNEMNGVIDIINHMEDESVERAKEYTDSQIDIVEASIATTNNNLDQINQSLQASIRSLNQSITVLDSEVDTLVERINATDGRVTENYNTFTSAMNQVYRDLNSTATQLRNYADLKDTVLREHLEAEIEDLRHVINDILEVETIDGLTGLKRTVRQILSTYMIDKVKRRGGNRFAMTWSKFKLKSWLQTESTTSPNYRNYINYFAPTWYNLMKTQYVLKENNSVQSTSWNTWGAFCNNTLLYLCKLIADMFYFTSYSVWTNYSIFLSFDVFKYSEWNAFKTFSTTELPSVELVSVVANYSGSNTHRDLIRTQMVQSVQNFIGMFSSYNSIYGGYASLCTTSQDLIIFYALVTGVCNDKTYSTKIFLDS